MFNIFKRNKEPSKKKIKVYLAGPIGKGEPRWRDKFKSNDKVEYINPETYSSTNCFKLVAMDKNNINDCDIFFAYIPVLSAGTSMEIVYAYNYNKPIVAVIHKSIISPWHKAHIISGDKGIIVNDIKQGKKLLNKYINKMIGED